MSVAPPAVAERVRAIDVVRSGLVTVKIAAGAVDCGRDAEAPLCPPTVGNHPVGEFVFSGLLVLADGESAVVGNADRGPVCAAGEVAIDADPRLDIGDG